MNDEKERAKRYSTISPEMADIGAQSPTNEHIDRLAGILLTYNFYEKELGSFFTEKSDELAVDLAVIRRICSRNVGHVCSDLRRYGRGRRTDLLVLCGVYESDGESPRNICRRGLMKFM